MLDERERRLHPRLNHGGDRRDRSRKDSREDGADFVFAELQDLEALWRLIFGRQIPIRRVDLPGIALGWRSRWRRHCPSLRRSPAGGWDSSGYWRPSCQRETRGGALPLERRCHLCCHSSARRRPKKRLHWLGALGCALSNGVAFDSWPVSRVRPAWQS